MENKELKLDDDYTLIFESNCVTLKYKKLNEEKTAKNKSGKQVFTKKVFYYSNIKTALNGYLLQRSSEPETPTLSGVLQRIEQVEKVINNLKIN
jgi:hypothetical protein